MLLTLAFASVDGRLLEKVIAEGDSRRSFCTDALLSLRNGAVARIAGYVQDDGHRSAFLVAASSPARQHWRRDGLLTVADVMDGDGVAHPLCSRTLLRRSLARLDASGRMATIGTELEFFLIPQALRQRVVRQLALGSRTIHSLYGQPRDADQAKVMDEVVRSAERSGVELASVNREYGGMQYEVSLAAADPLLAADNVAIARELIQSIAAQHGLLACFIPQPFVGEVGSGMHINIGLRAGDQDLLAPQAPGVSSDTLLALIDSMLTHMKSCCAVWCPSVNSYRRLAHPDFSASKAYDLHDRRDSLLRVATGNNGSIRLEVRVPDCLANPYASIALCLEQIVGLEPRRASEAVPQMTASDILPKNLRDAVDAMADDVVVGQVLNGDYYAAYTRMKMMELIYYDTEVSSLDFRFNDSRFTD